MMIISGLLGIHIPTTKTLRAVMLLALAVNVGSLLAQGRIFWQEGGVVVCDSTWGVGQAVASDDSGGIFVVWRDTRGEYGSVWAQRVDRDGNAVWQRNGVLLRGGNTLGPGQFSAVADGRGGLIAVWREGVLASTRRQVTAQRVGASGAVLWDSSGVVVAGSDSMCRYEVTAVSDARGGAIVAWVVAPLESAAVDSLVVQRLDSLGRPCWGSPGLVVATDTLDVCPPRICPDGGGGIYVVWAGIELSQYRTLAQLVDSTGHSVWPGEGVQIFSSSFTPVEIIPARGGLVILCGMGEQIRAQLLDPAGSVLWGADGRPIRASTGHIWGASGCDAGPCGTYVVWPEKRSEAYDVYSQLLDTAGYRVWDSLGVKVGSVNSSEGHEVTSVSDGRTGFIVSWPEHSDSTGSWDVYAQRVDSAGQLRWGTSGLGVAVDGGWQSRPIAVTDARGGAIVVWGRSYAGDSVGLCVQRIGDAVAVKDAGPATLPARSVAVRPSPATDFVRIDISGDVRSLAVLDATGRVVRTLDRIAGLGATSRFSWDLRRSRGGRVSSGVYFCQDPKSRKCLARIVLACHQAGL